VRHWVLALGVRIGPTPIGRGRPSCGRVHRFGRAAFFNCGAAGAIGPDFVNVEVTSLVGTSSTSQLPRGTQIVLTDIGH
jgi:hypothetical protein